jgi:hypothetical protein
LAVKNAGIETAERVVWQSADVITAPADIAPVPAMLLDGMIDCRASTILALPASDQCLG